MKKIYLYMTSIFSILFTTVAYSSLMTNISITSEVTIRAQSDIRITDIELYSSEESIISYESKYSKNTTTNGFVLSNTNSSISYSVTITNNGEIDQAIYNITNQSNNKGLIMLVDGEPLNQYSPIVIPFKTSKTIILTYETSIPDSINVVSTFDFRKVYYIDYVTRSDNIVERQLKCENIDTNITSQIPTKQGYTFVGWTDEQDGEIVKYLSNDLYILNQDKTLYAIWTFSGVAQVGTEICNTLQSAIDKVPLNNSPTTIILLKDLSENVQINNNQNIILNLQNYTLSNDGVSNVIKNYGTLKIISGKIFSNTTQGAINNYNKLIMTGGKIETNGTKQAIYNDGGQVEISGNSYLSSTSISRPTIQNKENGSVTITSGTIISTGYAAIQNEKGIINIGQKNNISNIVNPDIQGYTNGIYLNAYNDVIINFYDGVIKGKTSPIADFSKLNEKEGAFNKEEDFDINEEMISINGANYKQIFLQKNVQITFNPNGGMVTPTIKKVKTGSIIGELPLPTRTNYKFEGWYTEDNIEIPSQTIIENDITLYAHWIHENEYFAASIGDIEYHSLQDAINAVPLNIETTIKLLRNTNEIITITKNKNIIFDGQNYTLSNLNNSAVITNNGILKIINGIILSTSTSTAVINNTGTLNIIGGRIVATGERQAIYNDGGTLEISGNSYLSSTTSLRATIQNRKNDITNIIGTTIIKSGTIISYNNAAVYNEEGTVTIGIKDSNINVTTPILQGLTYAVNINSETETIFNFYDGILKGSEDSINGIINEKENNSKIEIVNENINNIIYKNTYLIND